MRSVHGPTDRPRLGRLIGHTALAALSAALAVLYLPAPDIARGDDVRVGAIVSLTGRYATNGRHMRNGIGLVERRVAEDGGIPIGGRRRASFTVIYGDDESDVARSTQLVERMMRDNNVGVFLGPFSAALSEAVAPLTEERRIPLILYSGSVSELLQRPYTRLYSIHSLPDAFLAAVVERIVAAESTAGGEPDAMTAALVSASDPYSQLVAEGARAALERARIRLVMDEIHRGRVSDMSSTLIKVVAQLPDILLVTGHVDMAQTMVRQIAEQRIYVRYFGLTHCEFMEIGLHDREAVNGALCPMQWHPDSVGRAERMFTGGAGFVDAFRDAYGYPPPPIAAQAAAAAQLVADAVRRSASSDPDQIRAQIAGIDTLTIDGRVRFDSRGRNTGRTARVVQFTPTGITYIPPSGRVQLFPRSRFVITPRDGR